MPPSEMPCIEPSNIDKHNISACTATEAPNWRRTQPCATAATRQLWPAALDSLRVSIARAAPTPEHRSNSTFKAALPEPLHACARVSYGPASTKSSPSRGRVSMQPNGASMNYGSLPHPPQEEWLRPQQVSARQCTPHTARFEPESG